MTERTRVPFRQSTLADMRFSPGDDTKPPLLTVTIGPKPEPRKETIPLHRVIDPQVKDDALRLLDAGLSVPTIVEKTGISRTTLYEWRKARHAAPASDAAKDGVPGEPGDAVDDGVHRLMGALDRVALGLDAKDAGSVAYRVYAGDALVGEVGVPQDAPVPTRWVVQTQAISMAPEEDTP
ncbi:helix-turn-helix domain-containing protein [Sulfobacillus harzensis]|uniref:Helix-turn-helix domain-containing protein n=1 Tax=Sulfobacillus harzensis TaxID=2729629 RepID=A0A7Y0L5S9_9FIRM|nr:helix-turn-helix domain-containing protein [Sulfobacillus harzensis]NMP23819.1 helix-turn-helix domain-containing protein [Sulfobacillus harzensis]